MKDFKLTGPKFRGYVNKTDLTTLEPGYLVSGSQNVITTPRDTIKIRDGYSLDGAANTALTPVRSSYDWITNRGSERNLRLYDDELEYRYLTGSTPSWRRLKDGFGTSVILNFAERWDTTELHDRLLFVDGTSNIYEWSGGVTTFASATATTITKEGATFWSEEGFYTSGTRRVIIDGTAYTYTGGEGTTTLTGVTPDPTAGGHSVGAVIHQEVRTTATTPASGFSNDLIAVHKNQIYIGSETSRLIYISAQNSLTNFTLTSPRAPGDPANLVLDGTPTGFIVQEDFIYISAGKGQWYQVASQLSADLTGETLLIEKLKTAPQDAAQSQAMIGKIKNSIIYISNEPTLDTLGRVESIDTPQSKPLSDPIKTDFDDYDFTNAHVLYFKNNIYVAIPAEGLVLVYNMEKQYWEAPQILPVRRLAIIGGLLYGHSSAVPETYKLFDEDTPNDNANPINAIAAFSYQNFDKPAHKKSFTEYYTEGYIGSNTDLTAGIKYDFGGFTSIVEHTIEGDDDTILFSTIADGSLGQNPIGDQPIGSVTDSISGLPKFRVILTNPRVDAFEHQFFFQTNEVDYQWEILRFGPAVKVSEADTVEIKK